MKKIIGFTAGAFDLFHVGHLNLIKAAKARCDYLIVGVNTDQLIHEYKKKEPIIPLTDRMALIESIKYVDEVVAITTLDKRKIWDCKRFDIIFIGDDWKGSLRWQQTEKQMQEINVEVLYLPYTVGISTSMLKERIKK